MPPWANNTCAATLGSGCLVRLLSSAGKKTLYELGIRTGDEITVGGVEPEDNSANTSTEKQKAKSKAGKSKKSKKSKGAKKKKPKQPKVQLDELLTEEQIMEKYRLAHSKLLTPVLEEMGPLLKDIRNKLNDLTIHKLAPKVRKQGSRKRAEPQAASVALPTEDTLGGKAGKVSYPVLVGEVSNLYNTNKSTTYRRSLVLDLHGLTKDEAIQKLDNSLTGWVEAAMKGGYPWVIPVDIVCGGGSQILSEVVKGWIQSSSQVANRPKNYERNEVVLDAASFVHTGCSGFNSNFVYALADQCTIFPIFIARIKIGFTYNMDMRSNIS